jgi:hypothetical protein
MNMQTMLHVFRMLESIHFLDIGSSYAIKSVYIYSCLTYLNLVGFHIFAVVRINVVILWVVTSRFSMMGAYEFFGGTCCLQFNIEGGSSMFFRNVGALIPD